MVFDRICMHGLNVFYPLWHNFAIMFLLAHKIFMFCHSGCNTGFVIHNNDYISWKVWIEIID